MKRNLFLARWGAMWLIHRSSVPFLQYAAAMPLWLGSMSRVRPSSWPGRNRRPGFQPKVEVASFFGMISMFSASRAPRKRTTCLAFSEVTVHPRSARAVMERLEKIVDRGYMALCHWPSRLKAISIFSSPVSRLLRRCVRISGVRHTLVGSWVFGSMELMPFSE